MFIREKFLPFSVPYIDDDDIKGVTEVLKSGWITTGPKTYEFEKNFSEYTGASHSIAVTSATAGMHLSLKALNIGPGDEVITSSMTWVSTVNLIDLTGAKPVFADIDPGTLMITKDTVASLITEKTKLIIPVHFAGAPADIDGLYKLTEGRGIKIIEDAAHAAGTEYKGRRIGSTGTSVFSFHPIKNITTAEGGMVCSDDGEFIEKIKRYKFHGLDKDAWHRYNRTETGQVEVMEPGYKYNMPDMLASLGLTQLKKLDRLNSIRYNLALVYDELLKNIAEVTPLKKPAYSHKHSGHLYIVMLDTDKIRMSRDMFVAELKKRNIGTGIHFHAVHLHYYYREIRGVKRGILPNTEWASDRLFSLPLFPSMTENDVMDVVSAIKDIICKI